MSSIGFVSERTSGTTDRAVGESTAQYEAHVSRRGPLSTGGPAQRGPNCNENNRYSFGSIWIFLMRSPWGMHESHGRVPAEARRAESNAH